MEVDEPKERGATKALIDTALQIPIP